MSLSFKSVNYYWQLNSKDSINMPHYKGKRILDIIGSVAGFIVCFPVIVLLAFTILLLSRKNPFFVQQRIGLEEKPFMLFKLRTLFPHEKRLLTRIGRVLRKYSLDELPQFLNVIRGEMSLVGPRPLLPEYLPFYNVSQRERHDVLPGITGWAQINGRNNIPWDERFSLDIWYVQNISWGLDTKILIFTLLSVFNTVNVKPEGLCEEEKFSRSNNCHSLEC